VIAPSHRDRFDGASVFTGKAYTTPLGPVPIARDITNKLITGGDVIQASWHGHRNEHALEVQLPFLQATLNEFSLVPIVLGDQHIHTVRTLAAGLSEALADSSAIIVASSDLSHYYDDAVARRVDQNTIGLVEAFDEAMFEDILQCEACGRGAIVTAMMTAQALGANRCKILDYRNSGDITGDYSAVVGYTAAALYTPHCN
jgi:AmmeMemoRadiSam system protein B